MSDKPVFSSQVDVLGADSAVSTKKVLRNTYMLLGMTLAFSANSGHVNGAGSVTHDGTGINARRLWPTICGQPHGR